MKRIALFVGVAVSMAFMGCGEPSGKGSQEGPNANGTDSATAALHTLRWEKNGIKVYALEGSKAYPDAQLTLNSPSPDADLLVGKNIFSFQTGGFSLGSQTQGASQLGLNNSDKGQHIHLILNNEPYSAHYTPEAEVNLAEGHYVMLAFLSRSYHESVKSAKAFVIRQFVVGQPSSYKEVDLNAPHLFYSRPKGEYVGAANTQKILLDFFVANCTLDANGNKVRAMIDGTEFMLTHWVPYVIEGLGMGEHTLKLELVDSAGALIPGPFNSVERKVSLKAEGDPSASAQDPHAHH